ncbi:MAG: hypothetical protein LQ347_003379, partial [Umbilicaria vellea]
MAIANREPLRKAGRKRGSGSSVQSSPSRHRSRHRSRRTYKGAPTPDTPLPAADEPTIDELRRARTAFFARKLNAPQKEMNKYTADQGSRNRKRELTAKSVSSRDSHIRVRKSSRRHHSDRPCSYGKRQETDSETSSVPVSCNASDTKGRSRAAMPRPTRRVSDSVASSGKGERRRTAEKPKTYRSEPRVESSLRRMPTHNGNERKTSMYVTETVVRTTRRRAVSADAAAHTRVPGPGLSRVECITCLSDDIPESTSALLDCGHRMCHDCLKRIFTISTTDPQHMPPTCCTSDNIPLKHVEKLFTDTFKRRWNKKYHEYTTKNRVYCPARGCGAWIKPADIHLDLTGGANGGRRYGKCGRCKTKVCCTCNSKWHTSRECPNDEETNRFVEVAKEEGWQRCFNCSSMVELREGCNHMTCRCRAEFCMICGLRWKTCDCPWFTYEAVAADRLQHDRHQHDAPAGRMPDPAAAPGYQEELQRRREQERTDEDLARRMQNLAVHQDYDGQPDVPPRRPRRRFRMTPSIIEARDAEEAAFVAAHRGAAGPPLFGNSHAPI